MKTNSWITNKFIAHRGLFDNKQLPENSLPAFEKAVVHGYAIELDVQMTTDGVLVVFHDDALDRMTKLTGDIREKTFDEIKDATLLDTCHKIPTFDQVLELVDGNTEILVEIKTHKNIGSVEEKVAKRLENYHGQVAIESFNPLIIRWFKKHKPQFTRGQLASDFKGVKLPGYQKFLMKNLLLCGWNGSQFVAYDVNTVAKIKKLQRLKRKMPILCWTVKSQEQYEQTKQYYDNIIFDSFIPTDNFNKEDDK